MYTEWHFPSWGRGKGSQIGVVVAMYTEWHFPSWGRGKGSQIGVVVRACVLQHKKSRFPIPSGCKHSLLL